VVEKFGGLDIAVANAGIASPTVTTARTMPGEEWKRVVDVNLIGAWQTARAALPQICERGGQIVFIGSIYSFANGMLASPYAVSTSRPARPDQPAAGPPHGPGCPDRCRRRRG
jgi:NAD(P)-dependent dehydrogenase (short-subunit alcohol dehydrogenase family)